MKSNEQFNCEHPNFPKKFPPVLVNSANTLAVYTVLCILRSMREDLGLEAMLEYTGKYLETMERCNPKLKHAVSQVISKLNVEKIYKEAFK